MQADRLLGRPDLQVVAALLDQRPDSFDHALEGESQVGGLAAQFDLPTGQAGGGSHFSAAVSGNEMLAETVESKLIFSRAR